MANWLLLLMALLLLLLLSDIVESASTHLKSNNNQIDSASMSLLNQMKLQVTPAKLPSSVFANTSQSAFLRHLTSTSLDYIDYESEANFIDMNSSTMILNREQLKEWRRQIEMLSDETYRIERIMYSIAYGLIVVLSFFGNLLVCRVCLKNMTKTNGLILSLAASDLMITVTVIPFNYFRVLNYSWPFGSAMCFIVNFVQHLVVYTSSYTMAIIAVQRYRSVCSFQFEPSSKRSLRASIDGYECQLSPSKMASRVSRWCGTFGQPCSCFACGRLWASKGTQIYSMRSIFISIFFTWLFAALISVLFTYSATVVARKDAFSFIFDLYKTNLASVRSANSTSHSSAHDDFSLDIENSVIFRCQNPLPVSVERFLENHSIKADLAKSVIVFITQYLLPLAISAVLYVRIGKIITQQGKLAIVRGNPKARIKQKKKRRRIVMLCLVVCAFGISWLPIHLFHIVTDAGIVEYHHPIFMGVHLLAMSSVIYNPFLYCWLNANFRRAALRVFCCCCVDPETNSENINGSPRLGSASRVQGKLLIKVPCCVRRSQPNTTELQHPPNLVSSQLTAESALGAQSQQVTLSAQSNMSVITETSMVAFTSIGSVERLPEMVVPQKSNYKSSRFNPFQWNKMLRHCSVTTNRAEVCQINIEECSDKGDFIMDNNNVCYQYARPEANADSPDSALFENVCKFQPSENQADSNEEEEEEQDDCLLNDGENRNLCRKNMIEIELKAITKHDNVQTSSLGDHLGSRNHTASDNGNSERICNQKAHLLLTTDL